MIKGFIAITVALALVTPYASAASKSPTPTPKVTMKSSPTPSIKTSAKPTASKKSKPVVKKKIVKKAPKKKIVKKVPKKRSKVSPSPSPLWPPKGFKVNGDIFAKVPTSKVLIGIASNNKKLTAQLAREIDGIRICEKYSCGAVQVASLTGCSWWEITAQIVGPTSVDDSTIKLFGTIRTSVSGSKVQQIKTILLISGEEIDPTHTVSGINVICHRDPATEKLPVTTYSSTKIDN